MLEVRVFDFVQLDEKGGVGARNCTTGHIGILQPEI
jgi:hypothetical protein